MRIAILLPDLRPGGAERMRLNMADRWLRLGFEVELVLLQRQGELEGLLPDNVTIVDLGVSRVRQALRPLVRYLRDEEPDALLAAMWPLTVLAPLAARLAGFLGSVVVSEHELLSQAYIDRGWMHEFLMRSSMRAVYPLACACVAVSKGVASDLAALSRLPVERFQVIYNPAARGYASDESLPRPDELQLDGPVILAVGTLKQVKRYDLLLRSFAKVQIPGGCLCILGEGQERPRLESIVRELGLQDKVLMPGYRSDTAPWYAHATLFVLSSDHEGFGNVIVESLEQGTPVVSTDCPSGPREILEDGKYGALVPVGDVDALAEAMGEALSRDHDTQQLKLRAQDFSVDKAADAYLDLLLPGWRDKAPA